MSNDALGDLSAAISQGLPVTAGQMRSMIEKLFGERYQKRHLEKTTVRDAYALATEAGDGVPYAGLINPDNSASGPFGGTSVDWFPSQHRSLIGFVVGTRGLAPDEGILTRPGHRRRIVGLRRYLTRLGIDVWSKPDPAALTVKVPRTVREDVRDAHRADVHQILAYASLYDAPEVRAILVYPLHEETWRELHHRGRDVSVADIYAGHRRVQLELRGLPFGAAA